MPALLSPAVLLLFGLLTGLSSSLDPRDPNVCSLWEFTTSVKESYSHPYDHVTEEPCSDPRTSNRCLRHITYRTAYRQAVKTDHRKRYQCCPGYYESGGKCVHCSKECVHGRCVAPDRCQCEGGWRGEDCSSCDDQHWGPVCHQQCKCKNGALCDPVEGACRCPPGFIGRYCDPCPAGTFGKGCLQRCGCKNGASCDKATGECSCRDGFTGTCEKSCRKKCPPRCPCQNGGICKGKGVCACPPGWTQGLVCTEPCPEGRFGADCARECLCHNRGKCDPETGHCKCAKGFTGDCDEECAAGTYGQDCKGVCDCANGARCFNIHGGCLCEPGFSGPQCKSRMCKPGNYGVHCEHRCFCEEKHTLCHPMKGECTCQPGWAGLHCNETCPHGFYGDGCLEPCLCVNGGECDGATGRCHCPPGFTGLHCENICKSGTYGRNCSLECSCENFIDCSPVDGTCFCKEWRGPDCSAPCSEGTWGPGCNSTCQCSNGAKCSPADGSCICAAGWQGAHCDQPCPMGAFGPGCLKRCDCVQASGCQPADGECHCLPGWRPRCSEPCPEGLWGPNCNLSCFKHCPNSDTCARETGECVCRPGYWGVSCQNQVGSVMVPLPPGEGDSWGAIGGIVVLVLLVVLLLVLLLMYRRRQKDKQSNTPTVSFSTSRTVNSEYAVPVPHSYHHYYSNPSYHTLSQNRPPLPHLPNNHDRIIKNTNNQLFCKNAARERRGLFGVETNATLPADWKHHEPRKDSAFGIDRRYSYSAGLGKYYNKELKDLMAVSSSSLNSENPYATIKDLPGLPPCPPESSYMEMKSAVPRERAYTEISPPPFRTATLSLGHAPHEDPHCHYDLPVNSHIPGHYDLPPLRRPPS
uniref:Platelet endothelial aggregation receptor 1 n=1 Tax=Oryzias melastigma TaxID=30732 RepID=A0A3B3CLE7_ORYME